MSPIPPGDLDCDSNVSESTGDEPYSTWYRQKPRAPSRGRSLSVPRSQAASAASAQVPVPLVLPVHTEPDARPPLARRKATSLPPRNVQFAKQEVEEILPVLEEEPESMPAHTGQASLVEEQVESALEAPDEPDFGSGDTDVEMPQAVEGHESEAAQEASETLAQAASAAILPVQTRDSAMPPATLPDSVQRAHQAHQDNHLQQVLWNSWQSSWPSSRSQTWWSQQTFRDSAEWWHRDEHQSHQQPHSWWESSQGNQAASAAHWHSSRGHHQDHHAQAASAATWQLSHGYHHDHRAGRQAASAARSYSHGRRSDSRRSQAAGAAHSQSRSRQQRRAASRDAPHVDRMMPVELPRPERDAEREGRVTLGNQQTEQRRWQITNRISVVGSNWGMPRGDVMAEMRRPTHVHLTCEFSTELARELAANHWTVCASDVVGGPAIVVRENTLKITHRDGRTWTDNKGEWQVSLVVASLEVVQAGERLRELTVSAMHVRNTVAAKPDKSRELLRLALAFLEPYQVDICYVDGNQAAHVRNRPSSALYDVFAAPAWLRTSEDSCLFGRTMRQADGGMCTGFLINQRILNNAVIWKHGLWQVEAEDIGLRARDAAYHLPSFLHLQAAGAATGWRRRSSAKQRERKVKYQVAAGSRRGAYKGRCAMRMYSMFVCCFLLHLCFECEHVLFLSCQELPAHGQVLEPKLANRETWVLFLFAGLTLASVISTHAASVASIFVRSRSKPTQTASAVPLPRSLSRYTLSCMSLPRLIVVTLLCLVISGEGVGHFPLTELDESTHLDLPLEVRLADQQRLRRQSIRALQYHERGTIQAPNLASVQELQVVAQCVQLDEVPFTSQMIAELWDQIPGSESSSHTLVDSNSFHSSDVLHELSPNTLHQHILPEGATRRHVEDGSTSRQSTPQGLLAGTGHSRSTHSSRKDAETASAVSQPSSAPRRASTHSYEERNSSGDPSPYNRWNEISDDYTSAATSSRGELQKTELEKYLVPSGTKRKRGRLPPRHASSASSVSHYNSSRTTNAVAHPTSISEYGEDPIDDFSQPSGAPIPTSAPCSDDDDPIESFDVMRDLDATPLDTLSGHDHDWVHGLPRTCEEEPASLLAFAYASNAASAAAHVYQAASAVEQPGYVFPIVQEGMLVQEVLTATTSEDEAPLTTLLTTRPGAAVRVIHTGHPSPSSPASAQGLSFLQRVVSWSKYPGMRVGEAKTPGPHVFLEQIPIYTKEGQKGILTTKWRPQQQHRMCQMSVGSRHTSCHQFSQIIAIQRWMSKHAVDLAATTQEEIQKRLTRAANSASQDGRLDDTVPDTLPSSASNIPAAQSQEPTTPQVGDNGRRIRRRYTSKKSQSFDTLPATEVASTGPTESFRNVSQAARVEWLRYWKVQIKALLLLPLRSLKMILLKLLDV
eukprot:6490332-Amphidinium_carterae.2